METELPGQVLAAQHRRIDDGVKGIADGTGRLAMLAESLALLRAHIYVEEVRLFPQLVQAGLAMPVFVMQREHGEMWPRLQALAADCAAATPIEVLREPALQLFQRLQIHNTKEEQIVYAALDRLVAESRDPALTAGLEESRVPEGWTCAMAPG